MTRGAEKEQRGSLDKMKSPMLEYYETKLADQQEIVLRCVSRWSTVGLVRGGIFLVSLATLFMGFGTVAGIRTLWFVLAGLIFLGFLVVAYIHEGMQTNLSRARLLCTMHRESIARLKRDWSGIKDRDVELPRSFLYVSQDLDLFGPSSIYKLLGICRTPLGITTLRDWIIDGADPGEIAGRQEAVSELAEAREWRERFRLKCEQLSEGQSGPNRFIEWCESESWFRGRRWLLWLARITTAIFVAGLIGLVAGWIPMMVFGPLVIGVFVVNFFASVFFAGSIHEVFNMISSRANEINYYVELFDMVSTFEPKSKMLADVQSRMLAEENDVRTNIHKLGLFVWLANIRRNGILFLVYLFFEFLFFWDAHALEWLERWKIKHGGKARGWFSDLGRWESLCALAKFADDHPDWVFPLVELPASPAEATFEATDLAHPLLDDGRVPNSVKVGPPGTVLLVTGSNMSGKSTLLRSIGANVVLAQLGTVVCARQLSMVPIHIETSMRIVDSLADGVSFFMAELKRLKEVVDQGKVYNANPDRTMLFLLDEILQGTNSRERQIAVSRVVRKLIDENAIGAISTHDLDLATTPELEKACRSVHFSETFHNVNGQTTMDFDYQMKRGIAQTTNALKLLEMVGLGDE